VRLFLPRRFTLTISDVDLDIINDGMIKTNFVYHDICENTNAYQLSLETLQEIK